MPLRDVALLLLMLHVTQRCCCVVTDVACDVTQGCCFVVTDFVCLSGMLLRLLQRLVCMVSCCRVWLVTEGCCCPVADFSLSLRDVSKFSASLWEVAVLFQNLACHSGMLCCRVYHITLGCCC